MIMDVFKIMALKLWPTFGPKTILVPIELVEVN
jgi:hypothetical protein